MRRAATAATMFHIGVDLLWDVCPKVSLLNAVDSPAAGIDSRSRRAGIFVSFVMLDGRSAYDIEQVG